MSDASNSSGALRGWIGVGLATVLGGAAGAGLSAMQPAGYLSRAEMLVEPKVVVLRGVGGNATLSVSPPDRRTVHALAEDRQILRRVAEQAGDPFQGDPHQLSRSLSIESLNNELFQLEARHPDAEAAQRLAEAWTVELARAIDRDYFSYAEHLDDYTTTLAAAEAEYLAMRTSEEALQRARSLATLNLRIDASIQALAVQGMPDEGIELPASVQSLIDQRLVLLTEQMRFNQELDAMERKVQQYRGWVLSWEEIKPKGSLIRTIREPGLPKHKAPRPIKAHATLGAAGAFLLALGLKLLWSGRNRNRPPAVTPESE